MAQDRRFEDAQKVMAALETGGYRAMLAGGCVRDRLLGRSPKDYDVATTARPDVVSSIFAHLGIRVVPTGLDHGTLTLVMRAGPIEVTTLRRDVATDGRRATIAFADDFVEDAARRDFTINAMYEARDGTIHDYFDGQKHLAERRLAFVGDTRTRIREDYLRILRFFRFWAVLGFGVDAADETLISEEAGGLSQVSQERITHELWLIAATTDPSVMVDSMRAHGVLERILPAPFQMPPDGILRALGQLGDQLRPLARIMAFYLPSRSEEEVASLSQILRLSGKVRQSLKVLLYGPRLLDTLPTAPELRMEFLDWCEDTSPDLRANDCLSIWDLCRRNNGTNQLKELIHLEGADGAMRRMSKKHLPITGRDIMNTLHLSSGASIGRYLSELRRAYRRRDWTKREEGLELLKGMATAGPKA